jgi:hypothetical protein
MRVKVMKSEIFSRDLFDKNYHIDDDECLLNRHNCFEGYDCYNTKGEFEREV